VLNFAHGGREQLRATVPREDPDELLDVVVL